MIFRNIKNKIRSYKACLKDKQAFTLVEIIVILFIISVGLLGVLSLVIQNIQSQVINKNNIIAYQLAQEGIELVRKTRDANWVNAVAWDENLVSGSYYMDYLDESPNVLTAGSDKADLYIDALGFYTHNDLGHEKTKLSRKIELETSGDVMVVRAQVTWKDRNKESIYNLETVLYDWID